MENGEFASGQWRHFSPNLGCVRKKTSCLPNQKIGMPSSCFEERRMLIVPAAPEEKKKKKKGIVCWRQVLPAVKAQPKEHIPTKKKKRKTQLEKE